MKDRFETLDIFRGIFSAMVVLFHMSAFADTPVINNPFVNNSDLFVDFFFVLSGFVIAYSYREINDTGKAWQFLTKRWLRIFPLHLVMLIAFVVVEGGKQILDGHVHINNLHNDNNNWVSFVSSLLLLNSVKMPGVNDVSWNIPSWSISAEMISYTFFAGMLLLVHQIRKPSCQKYYSMVIVLTSVLTIVLATGSGTLNYSYDFGYLRGLAGFFTGVLCLHTFTAWRHRVGRMSLQFFNVAEALLLVCIALFVFFGDVLKPVGFVYLVLFFLAVFVFAFEKGFVSGMLKQSGILKRMGTYSYSIYMTHALLLSLFNIVFIRLLHLPPSAYTWLFALNYLVIYKVSEWTYHHIEMRFAAKKKVKRKTSSTLPAELLYVKEILNTL